MPGKKNWFFADGYLPEKVNKGDMEAHEALMLFNVENKEVKTRINVFFSDREPMKNIEITVPAERVFTIRLDHPEELGGNVIPPLTQYALHIEADSPIICQFGRVDPTQEAMAYYVGTPYAE